MWITARFFVIPSYDLDVNMAPSPKKGPHLKILNFRPDVQIRVIIKSVVSYTTKILLRRLETVKFVLEGVVLRRTAQVHC